MADGASPDPDRSKLGNKNPADKMGGGGADNAVIRVDDVDRP